MPKANKNKPPIPEANSKNKPLKPINYNENPKEKAAKELSSEMVAQALRKWLTDGK